MNNSWFSKVAVWMVIAMVLFTVFKQFDGRSAANVTNVGYSEFLTEVKSRVTGNDMSQFEKAPDISESKKMVGKVEGDI